MLDRSLLRRHISIDIPEIQEDRFDGPGLADDKHFGVS